MSFNMSLNIKYLVPERITTKKLNIKISIDFSILHEADVNFATYFKNIQNPLSTFLLL